MMQTEREYAEALFMLANESGDSEKYTEALDAVYNVMRENPEYTEFLSSPAIPLSERCAAIDKAFESLPEYVVSFLKLLCENSHAKSVCECIEEYRKLSLSASGTVTATVTSATELNDAQKAKLLAKLEKVSGKTVFAEYNVDATLIGGIRIEIDGKLYDGSVKTRLSEVKDVIIG
ncbi:MAG: ATP synthase F1 subunit delta [Clostridia bacterium]|nr:ATP synthase F1 subunit delta [Clostridia bacterium]